MNKKTIEHIIDWRSRQLKRVPRFDQFKRRIDSLEKSFQFLRSLDKMPKSIRTELLRYIPISVVAAIEGYFVMAIRDLVDFGHPFSENAAQSINQRFELTSVLQLYNRDITIGELISHSFSFSAIENILASVSAVLGSKFQLLMREQEISCPHCHEAIQISHFYDEWMSTLKDVYRVRHILCHELASMKLRLKDIEDWLSTAKSYVTISETVLDEQLIKAEIPF